MAQPSTLGADGDGPGQRCDFIGVLVDLQQLWEPDWVLHWAVFCPGEWTALVGQYVHSCRLYDAHRHHHRLPHQLLRPLYQLGPLYQVGLLYQLGPLYQVGLLYQPLRPMYQVGLQPTPN